ncbi:MAG: TlpA family protein disulfide reductase [bacterium]
MEAKNPSRTKTLVRWVSRLMLGSCILLGLGLLVYHGFWWGKETTPGGGGERADSQHGVRVRIDTSPSTQSSGKTRPDDLRRWLSHDRRPRQKDTGLRAPSMRTESRATVSVEERWKQLPTAIRRGARKVGIQTNVPAVKRTEFTLPVLDGEAVSLKQMRGQWVLLNFWASWCGPCLKEMPALEELRKRLPPDNFSLVAINLEEERSTVRGIRKRYKLSFPLLLDRNGSIARQYQVRHLPSTWLLGPEGNIYGLIRGARDWDDPPLLNLLKRIVRQ